MEAPRKRDWIFLPAAFIFLGIAAAYYVSTGGTAGTGNAIGGVITLIVVGAIYFLPALIASARNHHNAIAILALNFLLGWTGLGWIGAFIWSLTDPSPTVRIDTR
jgi:hypothetical protein